MTDISGLLEQLAVKKLVTAEASRVRLTFAIYCESGALAAVLPSR
jgi:hypothetical protein